MECLSPFRVVSHVKTLESVLAGTSSCHARATFGVFPEPVGGGVVTVLYLLGHAPAPLHLPSVSSGSPAGRPMVEAFLDRRYAGWTDRFHSCPHRGGIPLGHRDDVCAGGLSVVHEANCQGIPGRGQRGPGVASIAGRPRHGGGHDAHASVHAI